jgi:Rrf2 family protein
MIFSRACQMAIQAVLYIAKRNEKSFISVKEIADDNNLSFYFLGKVIQKLARTGLLMSYKGPNGGVMLGKNPENITLLEIVDAIDGLGFFDECIVGLPKCYERNHCILHNDWKVIKEKIYELLKTKNVTQLIEA